MYGEKPVVVGTVDINPTEMMYWMYCPIKVPHENMTPPCRNLDIFAPVVDNSAMDYITGFGMAGFDDSYIYLTAKTMFVNAENPGNRPGWHSDGFLTDDINYVWSDKNPTVFWEPNTPGLITFPQDHTLSLEAMEDIENSFPNEHVRYPNKTLLRLNQYVIHKVDTDIEPGYRTFVKISFSKHKYNLVGNSINHNLRLDWTYEERDSERNHPIGKNG